MTTYILHGGNTSKKNNRNREFFQQILKWSSKRHINILIVYYARLDKEKWNDLFEKDKQKFIESRVDNLELSFDIASEDTRIVNNQIKRADVILIKGGNTMTLLKKVRKITYFEKIIQDKTIAGVSAGAYIFSTLYYANSTNSVKRGLDVLPIKLFTHYKPEDKDKLIKIRTREKGLPLITLHECDFVILHY